MLMLSAAFVVIAGTTVQGRVVSPEVHPDHTVTFRLKSPNAKKVDVSVEGSKSISMEKGEDGVWRATSAVLLPDIYGYTFSVDGVAILDPSNPLIKPNLIYVGNMVLVPGSPAEPWEVQDVAHGEVHHHFYKSKSIGDQRDYFVYTPSNYRQSREKLPVMYLLHGFSDTANGWTEVGRAHVILDNLIAQGKVKPMVVVMTLGYGIPDYAFPGSQSRSRPGSAMENMTKFREALLHEVIPTVEKDYRVSSKRDDRAIAGLSMGGAETLFTGLTNLDKFAYIGAFSSGGLPVNKLEEVFPNLSKESASKLKTLFISCGTEDSFIGFHRGFTGWLTSKGIIATTNETGGGHVWMNWRRNLAEFAGMIFR